MRRKHFKRLTEQYFALRQRTYEFGITDANFPRYYAPFFAKDKRPHPEQLEHLRDCMREEQQLLRLYYLDNKFRGEADKREKSGIGRNAPLLEKINE